MGWRDNLPWRRGRTASRAIWLQSAITSAVDRQISMQAHQAFDAAATPHYTDGWSADDPNLNDALAGSLPILRARSKGLARNNEWARRYLLQMRNNVLGPAGIVLQMRLPPSTAPARNQRINDAIEAAWWQWAQPGNCDISGRHGWQDLERLALYSLLRDGEILARHVAAGPHGYQLQLLNPSVLDVALRRDWHGNRVRMGIEIDDASKPIAYWLIGVKAGDDPRGGTAIGRHVRVPAAEILHLFDAEEADQLRGYPRLTVGAQRLWLLKDYEKSAAVACSNAAKRIGFFYTPTGEAPTGFGDQIISQVLDAAKAAGKILSAEEIRALEESARRFTTTVPGTYDTLPDGTRFEPHNSAYPNVIYAEYVKACVRGWSAGLGVSYATLGNDLESVNYSSARVGIIDEREGYRLEQSWFLRHFHTAIFEAWLARALIAAPALQSIAYTGLQRYIDAAMWQPRRWAGIDPNKEAAAAETNLALRLTSRRRLIAERGEDPDEIFAEIAAEELIFGPPNLPAGHELPPATADDPASPADEESL